MRNAKIATATVLLAVGMLHADTFGAIPYAPANWASDDIVTLIYDPSDGAFALDNPAGDDAAADAITTFEMTSTVDLFTGPVPFERGLFDVWSPRKAFILRPDGFFDLSWPAGSLAAGMAGLDQIITVDGSFLSGGPLEPIDLCCIPEPATAPVAILAILSFVMAFRKRD